MNVSYCVSGKNRAEFVPMGNAFSISISQDSIHHSTNELLLHRRQTNALHPKAHLLSAFSFAVIFPDRDSYPKMVGSTNGDDQRMEPQGRLSHSQHYELFFLSLSASRDSEITRLERSGRSLGMLSPSLRRFPVTDHCMGLEDSH